MRKGNENDRDIIRCQFENGAEYARRAGQLEVAACFEQLYDTVNGISAETLGAYLELFEDLPDGGADADLMEAVGRGAWAPQSATEYVQRFIASRSGADA